MTHDELLERIDSYLLPTKALKVPNNSAIKVLQALRAVVELHKPVKDNRCEHCYTDEYFGGMHIEIGKYPCETIQAIEKSLNG